MALNPTLDELLGAIKDGFHHFKQKTPTVKVKLVGPIHREPYVKGEAESEWCWVSVDENPVDKRMPAAKKYMGSVSTRGDDVFAALVAYSLCKRFGESIYDDAGYVNSGQEFTLAEFEEALQAKLDRRI
ncbi:hypothetical protein [Xylophilus ampelinus]|uniref:hypothetical protein n=1 Tax=Xylophilus ampelinus TaxID=54067 RepID=UPI0011B8565D|nr:hypothetical protein [Xylophilus ampelinus]MCS4511894.1 hypothetical protein [Xylophilus ampelinus]